MKSFLSNFFFFLIYEKNYFFNRSMRVIISSWRMINFLQHYINLLFEKKNVSSLFYPFDRMVRSKQFSVLRKAT